LGKIRSFPHPLHKGIGLIGVAIQIRLYLSAVIIATETVLTNGLISSKEQQGLKAFK